MVGRPSRILDRLLGAAQNTFGPKKYYLMILALSQISLLGKKNEEVYFYLYFSIPRWNFKIYCLVCSKLENVVLWFLSFEVGWLNKKTCFDDNDV